MATRIRLKRFGKKRAPFYRVVIVDGRKRRDGKVIEEVGIYHPMNQPSVMEFKEDRVAYWIGVGAQPSDAVRRLLEITGQIGKNGQAPKNTLKVKEAVDKNAVAAENISKLADEALALKASEAKKLAEAAKAAVEAESAEAKAEEAPAQDVAAEENSEASEAPAEEATQAEATAEESTEAPGEEA